MTGLRRATVALVTGVLLVTLATLVASPASALSSPPPCDWAQRAGGAGDDNASGLAVDAAGNLYVTGKFGGTATWGTGASAVTLNASGGSRDIYVASYQADGTLRWVVKAGGTGYDEGRDIAVDGSGHVYVTGQFTRTASFGPGPGAVSYTTNPLDYSDVFLARYDAVSGAVQWVVRAGGTANDIGFGVALDGAGLPVITGQFSATATFGAGVAAKSLTAAGGTDVFVAKYGAAGVLQWVLKAGGTGNEYGAADAVDAAGNVHVVGPFSGSGFWGWGVKLTSAGGNDAFVATYGPNGGFVRARSQGGAGADNALGIAVASNGTELVTGAFSGTASFGSLASPTMVTSAGGTDAWLAQYDPTGALVWVTSMGGAGGDLASVVTLDGSGAFVVTGTYVGPATFGTAPDTQTATSAGGTDVFVARFTAAGALDWLTTAGGSGGDVGLGVAIGPDGSISAAGLYAADMTFPTSPTPTTLDPMGIRDIYLSHYGP